MASQRVLRRGLRGQAPASAATRFGELAPLYEWWRDHASPAYADRVIAAMFPPAAEAAAGLIDPAGLVDAGGELLDLLG